jgi:hypothetical protein
LALVAKAAALFSGEYSQVGMRGEQVLFCQPFPPKPLKRMFSLNRFQSV